MKIILQKKILTDVVALTSKFTERRSSTLPVLTTVLLSCEKDIIHFKATNLETGVDIRVEGQVQTEGQVALPAQILREITTSFGGEGSVTLEKVQDTVVVSGGGVKSVIKILPHEDFPVLSAPNDSKTRVTISGIVLKSLISAVAPYASSSTVRPELSSVLLSAEGGVVKAVATDSFRLGEKKMSVSGQVRPFSILIPAKNALSIIETLPDEDIAVSADDHQCSFTWSKGFVVTRLVAVAYPDYSQIIPKTFIANATVLRKDFDSALKRASIFSDAFSKIRLGFVIEKKHLTLSARNTEVGESDEQLGANVSGESIELSFNHRYLHAPIPSMASESITLSAAGIGRPVVIKGVGDPSFLYLVMPMNQ